MKTKKGESKPIVKVKQTIIGFEEFVSGGVGGVEEVRKGVALLFYL